jgi:4-amino-4-deoxy-L-arabinose transferase-like glycosyltransferase
MAPGAPLWQLAVVAAGAGGIGATLKHLSRRNAALKASINFVMFTILIWQVLLMGYVIYAVGQRALSPSNDPPMWRTLVFAAILTLTAQSLLALRRSFKQDDRTPRLLTYRLPSNDVRQS